jgi:hypothetical protein
VDVNTNENTVRITTKPLAQLDDNDNIRTILKQDTNKQPIIIVDGNPTDSSFKIEEIPTNEIESITVLKGVAAEKKFGTKAKYGSVEIVTKNAAAANNKHEKNLDRPLIIINGKRAGNQVQMNEINEKAVKSMNVIKGKIAVDKYGKEGENGVIEISTDKPEEVMMKMVLANPIPTQQEKKVNGWIVGYGINGTGNAISRIIDDKKIDYKKAVILIDGKQSDYKTLEKINPNDVESVIQADIKTAPEEDKNKAVKLYGNKVLNGFIQINTKKQ